MNERVIWQPTIVWHEGRDDDGVKWIACEVSIVEPEKRYGRKARCETPAIEADVRAMFGRAAQQVIVEEPWANHPTCYCQLCNGKHTHRFTFECQLQPIWREVRA